MQHSHTVISNGASSELERDSFQVTSMTNSSRPTQRTVFTIFPTSKSVGLGIYGALFADTVKKFGETERLCKVLTRFSGLYWLESWSIDTCIGGSIQYLSEDLILFPCNVENSYDQIDTRTTRSIFVLSLELKNSSHWKTTLIVCYTSSWNPNVILLTHTVATKTIKNCMKSAVHSPWFLNALNAKSLLSLTIKHCFVERLSNIQYSQSSENFTHQVDAYFI